MKKVWRYGIYLDIEDRKDAELIKILSKAAERRRVGHVIREALHAYLGSRAAAPVQTAMFSVPPAPLVADAPPVADATSNNVSVLDKARKAFMK